MKDSELLSAEFAQRFQEVWGLRNAPGTLADLKGAWGERVTTLLPSLEVRRLFSTAQTRHEVEFQGQVGHTNCAPDALLLPSLTGQKIKLKSRCPHCEETVTVELTTSSMRSSHPEAVLSLGVPKTGTGPGST